jgi:hypothetical protein
VGGFSVCLYFLQLLQYAGRNSKTKSACAQHLQQQNKDRIRSDPAKFLPCFGYFARFFTYEFSMITSSRLDLSTFFLFNSHRDYEINSEVQTEGGIHYRQYSEKGAVSLAESLIMR